MGKGLCPAKEVRQTKIHETQGRIPASHALNFSIGETILVPSCAPTRMNILVVCLKFQLARTLT